jgi:hypothetical protein
VRGIRAQQAGEKVALGREHNDPYARGDVLDNQIDEVGGLTRPRFQPYRMGEPMLIKRRQAPGETGGQLAHTMDRIDIAVDEVPLCFKRLAVGVGRCLDHIVQIGTEPLGRKSEPH